MGALTDKRMTRFDALDTIALPLKAGQKAFQGAIALADTAGAQVVIGGTAGGSNLLKIGEFAETCDNSAGTGTMTCLVRLDHELFGQWYDNATGSGNITAANLFADAYVLDDHTVTTTVGSNAKAGRIWGVDSVKGVLVVSQPDLI